MKYLVRIGDEEHEVLLDGDGVHIDGEDVAAHVEQIDGTPVRMVTVGDEVHRVVVRPGAIRGLYTLWLDGYRFDVEALDERTRAIRDLSGKPAGPDGPRAAQGADARTHRSRERAGRRHGAGGAGTRRHGSDEDGERAARARPPAR